MAQRKLLPVIEAVLLVALVLGDPGAITRRSKLLRALSIALVTVLVLNSLWSTVQLIDVLINGGHATNSARELLSAGAIVWVSNNIAFALLYWELDSGGAAARAHRLLAHPDLAFPQPAEPTSGRPAGGWFHRLPVSAQDTTAFSPTDVMPLVPCDEVRDGQVQSVISLAILGLVVARAVNVFT